MIYSNCGRQLTGFPTPFVGQNEPPSDTKVVSPQGAAPSNYQMTPSLSGVSCWAETIVADSVD